jgi:epoxyqueuosine reductase QueG
MLTGEKRLSYRSALEAIGAYLDRQQYQELVLCELDDGYVIRARKANDTIEAIALEYEDLRELAAQPIGAADVRGVSHHAQSESMSVVIRAAGAYSGFLGALGRQCDLMNAETVSVVELGEHVLLTFRRGTSPGERVWREYLYDVPGIHQLLFSSGVPIVAAG